MPILFTFGFSFRGLTFGRQTHLYAQEKLAAMDLAVQACAEKSFVEEAVSSKVKTLAGEIAGGKYTRNPQHNIYGFRDCSERLLGGCLTLHLCNLLATCYSLRYKGQLVLLTCSDSSCRDEGEGWER